MPKASDLKILYHLAFKPVRGNSHAERMEDFYSGQADGYDDFRKRLLQGREELWQSVEVPDDAIWVDMGGGTGANLEFLGDRVNQLKKAYVVDLAGSLLSVADSRAVARGWNNVQTAEADATTFTPEEGTVDVVSFSYSLTMIPDWFAAIDNAKRILKPGGKIVVVDFYVSRKHPGEENKRHGWFTRTGWPTWFGFDNVFPSPDHVPYLQRNFETKRLVESRAKVPYLPLVRVPYYQFIGING
ncbi:MAG: class I SAM-dependent methyltransferase [Planctomycetota bacterium]